MKIRADAGEKAPPRIGENSVGENVRNILITGGDHQDRIKHATQQALGLLCEHLTMESPCENCRNCTRILHHTHPNVVFIEPEHGESSKDNRTRVGSSVIKIDQIRDMVIENNKANFERGVSVFIITQMHRATKAAANALLKVIEESKHDKIIIALAPTRASVIPTIASRLVCQSVTPNWATYLQDNDAIEQKILAISKARPSARFSYCERMSNERDELINELEELSHQCHVMVRKKRASPYFILKVSEALENAIGGLRINLNPRLVAERLILREWPTIND